MMSVISRRCIICTLLWVWCVIKKQGLYLLTKKEHKVLENGMKLKLKQ